jgi:hypothetical protein
VRRYRHAHACTLCELLEAQRNRKSERLSKEQLALFETLWKASDPEQEEDSEPAAEPEQDEPKQRQETSKRSGRQPLSKDLVREQLIHDLPEAEKHCGCCGQDLRLIGEKTSEGYEYISAIFLVFVTA